MSVGLGSDTIAGIIFVSRINWSLIIIDAFFSYIS